MKRTIFACLAVLGVMVAGAAIDVLAGIETDFFTGWMCAFVFMRICYEFVGKDAPSTGEEQ